MITQSYCNCAGKWSNRRMNTLHGRISYRTVRQKIQGYFIRIMNIFCSA